MPFFNFDELEKEFVTPKYSTAHGETVTGQNIEVVLSCKNTIGGVGHKIAPGERDRLEEFGKA